MVSLTGGTMASIVRGLLIEIKDLGVIDVKLDIVSLPGEGGKSCAGTEAVHLLHNR